jgi:nitrite reductase/ring-hydroxylating ferredoxin subunit
MESQWSYAIEADKVAEEDVVQAVVSDQEIAIYRLSGQFYATEDACTHGQASLSEGVVIGGVIECPIHQGRFCIKTGQPRGGPVSVALRTFATKVENGKIFVQLEKITS